MENIETEGNEQVTEQVDETQVSETNLKAEFSRKMENTQAELNQIKQYLAALTQSQQQRASTQSQTEEVDPYDPKQYAQYLQQQVNQTLAQRQQAEARRQQALAPLIQEFPELVQPGSELYSDALQILNTFDESERNTVAAYKAAVHEAAMKRGVQPMSRRKKDSSDKESFQLGSNRPRGKERREEDLNEGVDTWRQIMSQYVKSVDLNSKEVKERIKQREKKIFGGRK